MNAQTHPRFRLWRPVPSGPDAGRLWRADAIRAASTPPLRSGVSGTAPARGGHPLRAVSLRGIGIASLASALQELLRFAESASLRSPQPCGSYSASRTPASLRSPQPCGSYSASRNRHRFARLGHLRFAEWASQPCQALRCAHFLALGIGSSLEVGSWELGVGSWQLGVRGPTRGGGTRGSARGAGPRVS